MILRAISRGVVAALVLALAVVTPLLALPTGSRQTRDFVQAAGQSDEFERMEATTALAQSQDPKIRAFAQEMLQAHRSTSDLLKKAVAQAGLVEPNPGLGGDQSAFLAALQSQRGKDFDRTYVCQQMLAHRAALSVMHGYASSGDNVAIRHVASEIIPVIASHLKMIEQIQQANDGG